MDKYLSKKMSKMKKFFRINKNQTNNFKSTVYMSTYIQEFVNGSLDGLITSFSLISASLGGNINMKTLLVLAITGLLVDAYSMGVARYLSEKSTTTDKNPLYSAGVVGISFILFGIVPILPIVISNHKNAKYISIVLSLFGFFFIGAYKSMFENTSAIKNGIETATMGLSAAFLSYWVSNITNTLL